MKYLNEDGLDELKEILREPSFDDGTYGYSRVSPDRVISFIEKAIAYHEQLSNDNNAENQ